MVGDINQGKGAASNYGDGADNERVSIGEVLAILADHRAMILAFIIAGTAFGFLWDAVSQPEYSGNGLIQIEEKASAGSSALKELGPLLGVGGDTTVAAEQEILTSRMVLNKVIEKQRLNLLVEPKYFPLIGRFIARKYQGDGLGEPFLGLGSYAWGGERLGLLTFETPESGLNRPFRLVRGEGDSFVLEDDSGRVVLNGKIGQPARKDGYSIYVAELVSREGGVFGLTRLSDDNALSALLKKYSIKERGRKSGILEVSLLGDEPEKIEKILNDILNTYVRQNVDRRSEEAENTLRFLEKQLPVVKQQLKVAEEAYNGYRQSRGSLDLSIETQSVLSSIVDVENQLLALKQERDELRQYFTNEHPRIQASNSKIEKLNQRRAQFEAEIAKLPDTQQKVLQLARDVEVTTSLYTNLLNTSQQLRVSKAGTVGDVRIIDAAAVGSKPIGIGRPARVSVGLLIGLIGSVLIVLTIRLLRVAVDSPEVIEAKLGLPVYASIPHSNEEARFARKGGFGGSLGTELLVVAHPDDDAVESFRSLRATLHFALLDSKRNSILITGSSPGLGKSFVSKNLGAVIAQAGKRVVIVDADLRRGHINKEFGLKREIGVSEYIAGEISLDDASKPTGVPGLWVVTTGQIPPNPSELLMHARLADMLDELSERFDFVIVDAPPILAVADAIIIGRNVGTTLMVARSGKNPLSELDQAVKRLAQGGVPVAGFVFNDFDLERQRYRYGQKGYVYKYSYKDTA